MILLVLALSLQVLDSATTITVVDGSRATAVPIVFGRTGRLLPADALAAALGTELKRLAPDKFALTANSSAIEFTVGVPFAKVGSDVTPIGQAPAVAGGRYFVPLSVVTDLLPRAVAGFLFDARANELRRFRGSPPGGNAPRVAPPVTPVPAPRPPAPEKKAEPPVVVVDAGHGGVDRGMSGPLRGRFRIHEADITLQLARRVRDDLKARGIRVVMTRDRDTLIALQDRGPIANRAKGDVFVSIHVNAANLKWRDPGGARGFETYFLAEAKTEDERRVEQMENEASRFDVDAKLSTDDPLSFLLSDMQQNEHLRESSEFAAIMQRALGDVHPGPSRGVKQAGFAVLVHAYMPAILVEVGFGTNVSDANFIRSKDGQIALARAISDATITYLHQLERRSSGAPSP